MTDIVERLRADALRPTYNMTFGRRRHVMYDGLPAPILREAAAEIDRLRAEATIIKDEWVAARDEIRRLCALNAELMAVLDQMQAFVGVVHGEGPEAYIPENVPSRIGVPVKLGAIMRNVSAAFALAKGEKT